MSFEGDAFYINLFESVLCWYLEVTSVTELFGVWLSVRELVFNQAMVPVYIMYGIVACPSSFSSSLAKDLSQ